MESLNIKVEETWVEVTLEHDLETIENEELVPKLCPEEICIKRELEEEPEEEIENTAHEMEQYNAHLANTSENGQTVQLPNFMPSSSGANHFECTICHYKCSQQADLVTHMRTHTSEKSFECVQCNFKSPRRGDLTNHMRSHTGEKPFECTICNFKSSLKGDLVRHMRTHTGDKPFACNVCDSKFVRKNHLARHMRSHTGEKPFECHLCDYKGSEKVYLTKHMRTHTAAKPFECYICNCVCSKKVMEAPKVKVEETRDEDTIGDDLETARNEKLVSKACSEGIYIKEELEEEHREEFKDTSEYEQPEPEVTAGIDVPNYTELQSPTFMASSTSEKKFECNICNFASRYKRCLVRHMRIHAREKPLECSICNFKSSLKGHFVRHIRFHTGEKLLDHNICDYKGEIQSRHSPSSLPNSSHFP